jgi:hypothetical protein
MKCVFLFLGNKRNWVYITRALILINILIVDYESKGKIQSPVEWGGKICGVMC